MSLSMSWKLGFLQSHAVPIETVLTDVCECVFGCGQWELGRLKHKLLSAVTVLQTHTHTKIARQLPTANLPLVLLGFLSFHPFLLSFISFTHVHQVKTF